MKLSKKMYEGLLVKRYKRFFADVEYNGKIFTIHVPNTGSLKGVIDKNQKQKCWFTLHGDESKKLKGTLEAIQVGNVWVGINTSYPNKIVKEAALAGIELGKPHFKHWKNYGYYRSEFKISDETRLDGIFCVNENDLEIEKKPKHFIEIKNTTLLKEINGKRIAQFPDAVTERGQKHIKELMKLMKKGHKAELIFTVQRDDVEGFSPAEDIDPDYAELLQRAMKDGLIVTPVVVEISKKEIKLTEKILKFY